MCRANSLTLCTMLDRPRVTKVPGLKRLKDFEMLEFAKIEMPAGLQPVTPRTDSCDTLTANKVKNSSYCTHYHQITTAMWLARTYLHRYHISEACSAMDYHFVVLCAPPIGVASLECLHSKWQSNGLVAS